jgi:glucose-6-phosphate isomerase
MKIPQYQPQILSTWSGQCCLCLQLLLNLAEASNLRKRIDDMFNGEHINSTEDRAVLHVATRARKDQVRARGEDILKRRVVLQWKTGCTGTIQQP